MHTPDSFSDESRAPDDWRLSRAEFFRVDKKPEVEKSFSCAYGDYQDVGLATCNDAMPKISRRYHVSKVAGHMEHRRPSRLV